MEQNNNITLEIKAIADSAINNINRLTTLLVSPATSSSNNNPTHCRVSTTATNAQSSISNAVSELQMRFPSTGSSHQQRRIGRSVRPYGRIPSRPRPGRPTGGIVTRNIVFVEKSTTKVPTRLDKTYLEEQKFIVSSFDIEKSWSHEQLCEEISKVAPSFCSSEPFEFVKNSCGRLLMPNLPDNKTIDGLTLTKSISPTGAIYVRFLNDIREEVDCSNLTNDSLPELNLRQQHLSSFNNMTSQHSTDKETIDRYFSLETSGGQERIVSEASGGQEKDASVVSGGQEILKPIKSNFSLCPFNINNIITDCLGKSITLTQLRFSDFCNNIL
ncbi:uncharacterized protein LOC144750118 [Ciona intestinalis]